MSAGVREPARPWSGGVARAQWVVVAVGWVGCEWVGLLGWVVGVSVSGRR